MTYAEKQWLKYGYGIAVVGAVLWVSSDFLGIMAGLERAKSDALNFVADLLGALLILLGILIFIGESVDALARRLNQILGATSKEPATVQQVHRRID